MALLLKPLLAAVLGAGGGLRDITRGWLIGHIVRQLHQAGGGTVIEQRRGARIEVHVPIQTRHAHAASTSTGIRPRRLVRRPPRDPSLERAR